MRKRIKISILTIVSILALVFLYFYIILPGNSKYQDYNYSTKGSIEPPFSNISQGKSIPGTWEYKDEELTVIIAFNSDESCEVYFDSDWNYFIDFNLKSLIPGTFTLQDKQIELKLSIPVPANVVLKEKNFKFNYVLEGDQLNLTKDGKQYELKRIS